LWVLAGRVGRGWPAVVPQLLAVSTFVGGVILLVSGATPAVSFRLAWLNAFLPLPIIEASHFLGSLAGIGLLLLARGLQRRLDAAYVAAAALLAVGILASLGKGFDWEEALALGLMLAALLPCRRELYRRASLLGERFSPAWTAAVVIALAATAWLGFFAYRHVEYSGELWWRFALSGNTPRFLRALVGAAVMAALFAVARLLRPARAEPGWPGQEELDRAAAVAATSPCSHAFLALLGDKHLLFSATGSAFLMYGIEGRSWVSMGDPTGPDEEATELAWELQQLARRHGGWPVFYQVREDHLARYVDLGLDLIKLGEEARVPLAGFDLSGRARYDLRQALRRYKEKFAPVWEGRYLAAPGGFALPQVLTNLATLIGGGLRGVLRR